jgi:hypothetical protein
MRNPPGGSRFREFERMEQANDENRMGGIPQGDPSKKGGNGPGNNRNTLHNKALRN